MQQPVDVIECPSCFQKFRVQTDWLGRRVACPHCRQPVQLVEAGDQIDEDTSATSPPSPSSIPCGPATERLTAGQAFPASPAGRSYRGLFLFVAGLLLLILTAAFLLWLSGPP